MKPYLFAILSLTFLLSPALLLAKDLPNLPVQVRVHDTAGVERHSFYPFGGTYFGRVSIASGDIDGDGSDEIIIGAGQQEDPLVKVFSKEGLELYMFTAYHPMFRQGLNIAACDLDNDGKAEIITGAREGGGPHVRVFNPITGTIWNNTEFFAYDASFRGGTYVACGNVDEDADIEIVTGPGISGGPHLKVFSSEGTLKYERFVGSMPSNSGLRVIVANMNRQGPSEIVTTESEDGQHTLFTLARNQSTKSYDITSHALLGEHLTNVSISTFDFNKDTQNILVNHSYIEPETTVTALDGTAQATFKPFNTRGHGAQTIALHAPTETLQVSVNDSGNHLLEDGKYILVDVSEQRLYSFENGALNDTFLVSTGLPKYETPRGLFSVTHKLPVHDYRWSYGANNPNNYNIPNVKWNLRFLPHHYIHSATWHNKFGKKMSHGCINVSLENSEKIFSWASVGTTVEVRD